MRMIARLSVFAFALAPAAALAQPALPSPAVATPTQSSQAAPKGYVDSAVAAATAAAATATGLASEITRAQAAEALRVLSSAIGAAGGVAPLNGSSQVPVANLPAVSALTGFVDPANGSNIASGTVSAARLPNISALTGAGTAAVANVGTTSSAVAPGNLLQTVSGASVPASYAAGVVGPCDILAAAGTPCVAAHSVTRRMFGAYSGNLFQLTRASDGTTANIGSVSSGLYNAAAVASFCAATECYFSNIYDQTGNANHLSQATIASMAPWWVHPVTGLPVVWTPAVNAYYRNRSGTTNIPTGTAASTVYYVRGSDIYSACCGDYGRMETSIASIVSGSMFALGEANWTGNGFFGWGVDLESFLPSANVAASPPIGMLVGKLLTGGGILQTKLWNAATGAYIPQLTAAPPTTPVVQAGISLGEGGDASAAPAEFFEGAITTGATTDATDALIAANVKAFYGSATPAYLGPVDVVTNAGCAGSVCQSPLVPATTGNSTNNRDISPLIGGAWGLRKLRAGYTGFAATIVRASDSASANIGFTAQGDFDDGTAQTFCAGTTCAVQALKNQAITVQSNSVKASCYDMTAPSSALRPTLNFNSIGGKSSVHGNGSQYLVAGLSCMTQLVNPWTMGAVARRTAAFTTLSYILSANGTQGDIGYAASANTAVVLPGGGSSNFSATATDSAWNAAFGTALTNGNPTLTINGGSAATGSSTQVSALAGFISLFSGSYYISSWTNQDVFTGDIAEAFIAAPGLTAAQVTAIYANQHAYYGGVF